MSRTGGVIDVTKLGSDERTGVPKEVQKLLGVKPGDKVVWKRVGKNVVLETAAR